MPQIIDPRAAVLDALREVLGRPPGEPIDEDLRPIGDLGFTSPDGLDFVCELQERLRLVIPDKLNPFVDDVRRRARSVRQIIQWVEAEAPAWPEVVDG